MFPLTSVPVLSDADVIFFSPIVILTPNGNFWIVLVLHSVSDMRAIRCLYERAPEVALCWNGSRILSFYDEGVWFFIYKFWIFSVVPCCMLFQSLLYCFNSCTSLHFKTLKSHTKTHKIRPYMFRSALKLSSGGLWPYFATLLIWNADLHLL
jgi:hypothetical protein